MSDFLLRTGLIVYAAFAPIAISGQVAGMLLGILGWLIGGITRKNLFWMVRDEDKNVLTAFGVFLGVFILSSIFSVYPPKSFDRLRLIPGEMSFFFISLAAIKDKKFLKTVLAVLLISASLESIYGIIQYFTGLNVLGTEGVAAFGRIKGTMAHQSKLGALMALILPVGTALALNKDARARYIVASVLVSVCLILTFIRGAWLGAAAAILALAIVKEKRLIFVLLITVLLIFIIKPTRERIVRTFTPGLSETLRMEMMKASLKMFADRPILGQGPNTFQKVFYEKYLPESSKQYFDDGVRGFSHPHNTYLGILSDTGVLGFGAFVFLIAFFFKKTTGVYVRSADVFYKTLALGILCAFIDFLVNGMSDYVFSAEPSYFFWFLMGIVFFLRKDEPGENANQFL
jgi:putative inorganic carbon (HCO3(-)) transporter